MASTPADDGSDRWVGTLDDAAAVALVWGFAIVVAHPAFDYLLYGPGTTFGVAPPVALVLAPLAVAAVAVGEFVDRLDSLLSPDAAGRPDGYDAESVWDEVLLFGVVTFPVGLGLSWFSGFVVGLDVLSLSVATVVHHAFLVGVPLWLILARRRGLFSVPSWLRPADWGGADYVALFGSTFVLCWVAFTSNYGYSVVVPALAGLAFGTAAVVLRGLGALVPDEEGGDSGGPGEDRRDDDRTDDPVSPEPEVSREADESSAD